MKRILFFIALCFAAASTRAQTMPKRSELQPINANGYEWLTGSFKNGLYFPPDTLQSADSGAAAIKNGVMYLKNVRQGANIFWGPLTGTRVDIDVFGIFGQSNAKGKGDSLLSPRAISGKVLQINMGVIKDANDPMGQDVAGSNERSQYGSAWPSFGNTYYNKTSRLICMVPTYKGGTSQCAAADVGAGNWDTTGVLFDSAVARVFSAMGVLAANGYNPIFKGIVWLQGESDAIALQSSTITIGDYTAAFTKMIRKFRGYFGASMPFNIIRVGTSTPYIDSYWQQVRDAQQSIANSDSMTQIVYYNAANFVTRGLMQGDGIHYNQVALNEVGQMTANAILSHNKNIWQPQEDDTYFANSGSVGIGGPPTESFNLEINNNKKKSSRAGEKNKKKKKKHGVFSL